MKQRLDQAHNGITRRQYLMEQTRVKSATDTVQKRDQIVADLMQRRELARKAAASRSGSGRSGFGFTDEQLAYRLLMQQMEHMTAELLREEFGGQFIGTDDAMDVDSMDYDQLLALGERIGSVKSKGAEPIDILRLPETTITTATLGKYPACAICLESFKETEKIRTLPCFHRFHSDEIDKWLTINKACPSCQTPCVAPEPPAPPPRPPPQQVAAPTASPLRSPSPPVADGFWSDGETAVDW
jgi:hypothetical protein